MSVGGIDGHQRLAHIARTGVWIGHGPVMTGRRRTIGVVAAEATVLLHVSLAAIERIKSRTPEAARWIGSISDFTQDYAIATAADLLIRQSDQRVAAVLLRVTDVLQGTQPQNAEGFAITQVQLAEMSAIGRDVCNGVLGRLETLGVVACHYGRIAILEPERLARLAETGKAV